MACDLAEVQKSQVIAVFFLLNTFEVFEFFNSLLEEVTQVVIDSSSRHFSKLIEIRVLW